MMFFGYTKMSQVPWKEAPRATRFCPLKVTKRNRQVHGVVKSLDDASHKLCLDTWLFLNDLKQPSLIVLRRFDSSLRHLMVNTFIQYMYISWAFISFNRSSMYDFLQGEPVEFCVIFFFDLFQFWVSKAWSHLWEAGWDIYLKLRYVRSVAIETWRVTLLHHEFPLRKRPCRRQGQKVGGGNLLPCSRIVSNMITANHYIHE